MSGAAAMRPGASAVPPESPLRVAVNATPLLFPLTGIGYYIASLMQALEQTGQLEPYYFYAKGWAGDLRREPLAPAANMIKQALRRTLPGSYALSRWVQQRAFTDGLRRWPADVYHEPNFLTFDFDGATVLTAHDLSWVRYPETHPIERVRAMERYFEPSLNRADATITPTHFVKDELCEVFAVPASKVHVTPEAADASFRRMTPMETAGARAPRGLNHGQYWAAVGTLEPRKNLTLLLDAFSRLSAAERQCSPLIIMGTPGWLYDDLLPRLRSMIDAGEVIYTDYLPRAEQATLLAGARALIYPSLYEGFGLPLVEAMQCGVPVIAANAASLPEVLGGAGVLVDPRDVGGLTERMRWLLESPGERTRMAALAHERSRRFDWTQCARLTLGVYQIALSYRASPRLLI